MTTTRSEFLIRATERFKMAEAAEAANRADGLDDLKFRNLDQWPANIKAQRSEPGRERPCLTIDQIGPAIDQAIAAQRQANPAIQINPKGGGATKATAEKLQGLIRAIEFDSDAPVAYEHAFECAVTQGWGYFRIVPEYDQDDDGKQVLKIKWVDNAFSVYYDPTAAEPDLSDALFCIITKDYEKQEYDARWPDSQVAKLNDYTSLGDDVRDWFPSSTVRVAEYFYVEVTKDKNGRERRQVKWCLHNAIEILEGNESKTAGRDFIGPGASYIPVIQVVGKRLNVNGQVVLSGKVRAAKDPQRQYNFQNSALTEKLALETKAPYIGVEGSFEGHEAEWALANVRNFPYLEYKPTDLEGRPVAHPPMRSPSGGGAEIQAIALAINQAKSDLRTVTGYYDATDPNRKNTEQSGRAILARKDTQSEANINYLDNLGRALVYCGKQLVQYVPMVYSEPGRVVQILGMDDDPELIMLNQPYRPTPDGPQALGPGEAFQPGQHEQHDFRGGKWSVTVSVGASYQTRRQDAAASMLELFKTFPPLAQIGSDVFLDNSDFPGAAVLAERAKKMLPPQVQDTPPGQMQIPPQVQQQLQQASQQIQMLAQELEAKTKIIEGDQLKLQADLQKAQLDSQTRIEIARINAVSAGSVAEMKVNADRAQAILDAEVEALRLKVEQAKQGSDHLHEHLQGQIEHDRALEMQAQMPEPEAGA